MKDNHIDILNLEWSSGPARDRNMSSLVANYLRYQGLSVVEESVFHGFEMIKKYRPKLLFIANGIGASYNFQLVKYASLKGIKVVTLISEGNFLEGEKEKLQMLYGWNVDCHLYEDLHLQWSERTRKMSLQIDPSLQNKIKVSGGCGFDIYKMKPPIPKKTYLKKYNKDAYTKVIGVGCWDFSHYCSDKALHDSSIPVDKKKRFLKDRDMFEATLLKIIEANPSVLFILKEHPGNNYGLKMSAILGTEKYDNALILKKESIVDVIAVSDFWLTYESTTVIEAWLLGKQTCLLNPSGIDFPRANTFKGSPNYPNFSALQSAIESFYSQGALLGFDGKELLEERRQVIKDTIQWDDGLNHVRAGNEIIAVLNRTEKKRKKFIPFNIKMSQLRMYILNHLRLRSYTYQHKIHFSQKEVKAYSSELFKMQIDYYRSLNLTKETLRDINVI